MSDETKTTETEKAWKLTLTATGELVGYVVASDCVPAKTLTATACTVEEAQAWLDEQASKQAEETREREQAGNASAE